jgi:prophage DNA circulation protein
MPVSELVAAKRKAPKDRTPDEAALVRNHFARYRKRKLTLHVRETTRADWEAKAEKQDTALSAWIVQRVLESQRDRSPEVEAVHAENRALREEVATLRRTVGSVSTENSRLQEQLRALEKSAVGLLQEELAAARAKGVGK